MTSDLLANKQLIVDTYTVQELYLRGYVYIIHHGGPNSN